ncbi:MAG: TonB-dependent receptor, partial [Bacteroidales bacterium]|nr:TonB-dependent receptor [Bacteroidales bacterium]
YKLEVSFISYKTRIVEGVVVKANQVTDLELILLEEDSQMLEGVVVKERRKTDTEVSMISTIQTSKIAVTGITKEQISRSLDKNAAEVVRRIPGITIQEGKYIVVRGLKDRYNTAWLNGAPTTSFESDKKSFSFDVIPSSALDNIMVYKTPAPELPADFAGAAVMIYTRNVPDENRISIGYKAGFRTGTTFEDFGTYRGGSTDWLGFDDGTRSLPEGFPNTLEMADMHNRDDLGLPFEQMISMFEARDEKLLYTGRNVNKNWTPFYMTAPIDNSVELEFNRKFDFGNVTAGNITALIYKNDNQYRDVRKYRYEHNIGDTNYRYRDHTYENEVIGGLLHNWSFMLKNGTLIEFRNLFNQIGTKRYTFREGYDFYRERFVNSHELNFMSRTTYSGQLGTKFEVFEDAKLNFNVGYAYANRQDPDIRRIYSLRNTDSISDYFDRYYVAFVKDATPELNGRLFLGLEEDIWNGAVNYEQILNLGAWRPTIKAGLYYEDKKRSFDARNIGFTQSLGPFNQDIMYIRPYDSIYSDTNIVIPNGIVINENTSPDDSYKALSQIIAGYIGVNIPIGSRLNIYGGVRAELSQQKLYDFYDNEGQDSLDIHLDTLNFFPSINISFDLTEELKIRAAYGMTTNRPEFRELAPYAFYDFVLAAQIYGYDSLQNAYIHNYDLRLEWYPAPGEIFTIGGFYKDFKNPIENTLIPASTDKWTFQPVNAKESVSIGVEIDIKKSLRFLENSGTFFRHFKDLFIIFNAALIKSEVLEGVAYLEDEKRPMQGQSPYIINAGLYYDNPDLGLMASLAYNRIGKRIQYVGDPSNPHTYEMPRNDLEFAFTKTIGQHLKIKAGIENIFNDPYRFIQTYEFQPDPDLNGNSQEVQVVDQVQKEYYTGRKFSLGAQYIF